MLKSHKTTICNGDIVAIFVKNVRVVVQVVGPSFRQGVRIIYCTKQVLRFSFTFSQICLTCLDWAFCFILRSYWGRNTLVGIVYTWHVRTSFYKHRLTSSVFPNSCNITINCSSVRTECSFSDNFSDTLTAKSLVIFICQFDLNGRKKLFKMRVLGYVT